MLWFNVCLSIFDPQELFAVLLRPGLENAKLTAVRFVLKPSERERWERAVVSKAYQRRLQASKSTLRPSPAK
jgi:hypothetical protein